MAPLMAFAEDEVKADEGILIIRVQAHMSHEPASEPRASGVWLKNLKTGKSYGAVRDTLLLKVLPEGDYCVAEIELFPRGTGDVFYCGEPYIHVARGKLNNAGEWMFKVDQKFGQLTLEKSLANADYTLAEIRKKYPAYFE
jgi:hypothetical protein